MNQYENYPKYKTSGVDGLTSLTTSWIGDVPEVWQVQRLKWSFETMESGTRETGGGSQLDDGIFSLGGEHVGWFGEIFTEKKKYISEEYFAKMKTDRVRARRNSNIRFFKYILRG